MRKQLHGTVTLPGSKSESNRALMIAAYGGFPLEAENLSEAHDTVLLRALLNHVDCSDSGAVVTVDCEDAGTVSRFMMTYLSCKQGSWLLTGTERLRQRPMAPLIVALRQLGADITCLEEEGCLPVRIQGRALQGGDVGMDVSQSSQFATSLLLAAPVWEKGLRLRLESKLVSEPYLQMTVAMMRHFGADVAWEGSEIIVRHQLYRSCRFAVSVDWSSASYWYEMMALSEGGELLLEGLEKDSFQGDSMVAKLFETFGVRTVFERQGVRITKNGSVPNTDAEPLVFDFTDTPDLFPAVFVTCVALHLKAVFKGIATLSLKESNRINSLISELSNYYKFINILYDDTIMIEKSSLSNVDINEKKVTFNTYNDHRIAMALAGLSLRFETISFDSPNVVCKSYPDFWDNFKTLI